MLIVYPNGNFDGSGVYIRPTPLVSISKNVNKNNFDLLDETYSVTLNGTAVISRNGVGTDSLTNIGERGIIPASGLDFAIKDQTTILSSFQNGCGIEILDVEGDKPLLSFYAKVDSINFEEGVYVDLVKYTVNLTADYIHSGEMPEGNRDAQLNKSYHNIVSPSGSGLPGSILGTYNTISDFNDTWSIEVDESNSTSLLNGALIPRGYRVTRNVSAVGKKIYPHYKEAWQYALDFIHQSILSSGQSYTSLSTFLSSTTLSIPSGFVGYNHVRSENLDKAAGSYSISDTWVLGSGTCLENYNISVNSSRDNPYISVSIDGNVKGLSSLPASGYFIASGNTPYDAALTKYYELTNSGQFGLNSHVYKRANASVAHTLNSQPLSIALGTNFTAGEITYNLQFDNRPTNIFSGVLSENITINDTYPGDVFAVIPVLGRETGPILQYIGGRTEYKRDVGIEIVLDYSDIGYGEKRANLIGKKPSLNEPLKTDLLNLIGELSPKNEVGIRKYFQSPPTENWNPKEGRYSLNLSWTYELDR